MLASWARARSWMLREISCVVHSQIAIRAMTMNIDEMGPNLVCISSWFDPWA